MDRHKLLLETALLAGQIMTESNGESYRVEDTMNRMLTLSKADYAVAVSFSTSLYATLDDASFTQGSYVGIKRITRRSNNLHKISIVNKISRELTSGIISVEEAYLKLRLLHRHRDYYQPSLQALSVIGLCAAFAFLFGGGWLEGLCATAIGVLLAWSMRLAEKRGLSTMVSNVIQAFMVTMLSYLAMHFFIYRLNVNTVVMATLMPMVPGTAITNSLRDIFREDYLAGGARGIEAFLEALMIAIGSALALALLRRLF